ncbi:MAG: phenylacetate--CoA ligase [Firmicutes bacterium]|nr:phenylacetate--CoA ligase [Bacillota bacterium]
MYWNKQLECLPAEELTKLQLSRLQAVVERVFNCVPHYRKKLQAIGFAPGDLRSLEDLQRLPFTTKQDLRDNYPFGLLTVPRKDIVRIHASSGTTGKPTVVAYTRNDLQTWADLMARALTSVGTNQDSVVQIAYGYGLFTGGLGIHYGAELIGASVIPISGGNSKRQIMVMQDFGTTVLACTPSYALHLAEIMGEMGVNPHELSLKAGVFGAEPWSDYMRQQIENKLGIAAYDIYGLSEIIGPGVAMECPARQGLHLAEDHFLVEIIDPETGEVLPEGETGELVITTLTKEALPVIRYRTRDITAIHRQPCACGRTHARMEKVTGRSDDMIIIRGVNVFPSQVESVLLQNPHIEPFYQLVVDRQGTLDQLEVLVEVSPNFKADEVKQLEQLRQQLRRELENTLGVSLNVRLVEPKTIERTEGKAKRVIDRRII